MALQRGFSGSACPALDFLWAKSRGVLLVCRRPRRGQDSLTDRCLIQHPDYLLIFLHSTRDHSFACRQVIFHDRPSRDCTFISEIIELNRNNSYVPSLRSCLCVLAYLSLFSICACIWTQRMSKPSAASASKLPQFPQKSAWARGPPNTSSAPTPRSQSPAPTNVTSPVATSHSRRPSTLGQAVAFKDGARSPVSATQSGV